MAIDNTPPRLKLIITIGAITIITLVAVDFALKSYYGFMTDEAARLKLAPTTNLDEHHKAEKAAFASAATPLDQAMNQLAKGSRSDIITPKPSDDLGPMTGWSKLPKPAPTPEPKPAAPTPPAVAGDGGAPMPMGDGGAPKGDAGAPKPPPPGAPHK